jgi:signal transduction histidine kinase
VQWLANRTHSVSFTHSGSFSPVMIDRNLMRRALLNLLTNAVKYSPSARVVYFNLDMDEAAGLLSIQIRDEGIGIPEDDLTHLFDTFFRASNARHIPGTGLGLAIVKRAVDAHRGTISVHSEIGLGTTFSIQIPVVYASGDLRDERAAV